MKKASLLLQFTLLLIMPLIIHSQGNIGINNNSSLPDPSAMLDVNSTDKGVLIPRMSTTERNDIVSPASGLMVYNTTLNRFNFYNGSTWEVIGAEVDNKWTMVGSHIYNNNSGNVGIGTDNPARLLTVEGEQPDLMLNQESTSPSDIQTISFAVDGMEQSSIHHDKSLGNLVIDFDKEDTGTGDILFKRHGDDRLAIRNNGSIEMKKIGDDRLAIRPTGKFALEGEDTDILLDAEPTGQASTGLKFALEADEKSSLLLEKATKDLIIDFGNGTPDDGDFVVKRRGDDMLAIRGDGSIEMKKIGDDRLAIRPDGKLALEGEDTDFIMDALPGGQNETGLIYALGGIEKHGIEMDKTTMDLVFEFDKNDTGTGDILFKRHGDDRLAIRNDGNVGIGVSNPTARLDVAGSVRVADDDLTPNMENVGAIRYRVLGEPWDPVQVSLCEMVMQVGPGTYDWVIIKQNEWNNL